MTSAIIRHLRSPHRTPVPRRSRLIGVVAALAGLASAASCTASDPQGVKASASRPRPSTEQDLRAALIAQADLPAGFVSKDSPASSDTGREADGSQSTVPLDAMTCLDLLRIGFLTIHARPVAAVTIGIARQPADKATGPITDDGWFGQEGIALYAPGRAAQAMTSIRRVAARCHSFTDTAPASTYVVSVTGTKLGADEGLILTYVIKLSVDDAPMTTQTGFLRSGDVIISVNRFPFYKAPDDINTVLTPAWAAYQKS